MTLVVGASIVFVGIAASQGASDVLQWDWLLLTGVLLLVWGIYLADRLPDQLRVTVQRLADRGLISIDEQEIDSFVDALNTRADVHSRRWGPLIALVILALFEFAGGIGQRFLLALFEAMWGYMAGRRIGRMVFYGFLGLVLSRHGKTPKPEPGHLDGAAGLKPIGDFFLRQALIVALPAGYLAVWLSLFPFWPRPYDDWRAPYFGALPIVIGIEVLAFVLPMWTFHNDMRKEKQEQLREADQRTREIAEKETLLRNARTEQDRQGLQEVIARDTATYWNVENMPTWPVAYKTKKGFTAGNVAMALIPILSDRLGRSWGEPLAAAIRVLLNGQ